MKIKPLVYTLGLAIALCASSQNLFAADAKEGEAKATASDKAFMKKAANGGMTEVSLGKLAGEKGESKEVKDFGDKMVKDHTKIADNLKEVAGKLGVTLPEKVDATHQAKIDKMEKMSGAAFDKAYVNGMVMAHEKDIAAFEEAGKETKNEELKKFIDDSVPTMKEHLEMIKKFSQAKKG
jgi:putative membrane protein